MRLSEPYFVLFALTFSCVAEAASPRTLVNRTNVLQFVSSEGKVEPVRSISDWEQRRASVRLAMEEVMGPLPGAKKRCPLHVRVDEEVDCGQYVRRFISYAAEPGGRVPAY